MSITNRYVKRSKISEAKFRELVRYFALDLDAHKIAALTRLNRNTVNRYLLLIRKRISEFCDQAPPVEGWIATDLSRLGARGAGGNGGPAGSGKTPAIGIFQRGGSIYTGIIQEGAGKAQADGRLGRIEPDSILRAESWRGNGDPVEPGETGAGRRKSGTSRGEKNANGIRSFRAYARRRLVKFRGVPGTTFYLHLKESEFRFNCRNRNIYLVVLKLLREKPLS
jgi:transposase